MNKESNSYQIVFLSIFIIGFFFFTSLSPLESSEKRQWDDDGGGTIDYSGIQQLKRIGLEKPDTYAEYLLGREAESFRTSLLYSTLGMHSNSQYLKTLVLVNNDLYAGIQPSMAVYATDLERKGYLVEMHSTSGGTPQDLKNFIHDHSDYLVGCIFIGDHPVAWYELNSSPDKEFPCDIYYMDLDGTWIDSDGNGIFDTQFAGSGDEGPEIFIGHIDASMMTGNEETITNDYFKKNHAYYSGKTKTTHFALTYTEPTWKTDYEIRTSIKYAYRDYEDIFAPTTNKHDYLYHRIQSQLYEFIQLACHSTFKGHHFNKGGKATNYQIQAAAPQAVFYNLFACSALRYTKDDFLGGSYIYNGSKSSLAVLGSTKSGGMRFVPEFYKPFGSYEAFGEAFRLWFNSFAPYDNDERSWHFGMSIAGDPFLTRTKPELTFHFHCIYRIPPGNHPSYI